MLKVRTVCGSGWSNVADSCVGIYLLTFADFNHPLPQTILTKQKKGLERRRIAQVPDRRITFYTLLHAVIVILFQFFFAVIFMVFKAVASLRFKLLHQSFLFRRQNLKYLRFGAFFFDDQLR